MVETELSSINRSVFTSAQHLFVLITIGLHVSTVIQSSSGPSQRLQVTGSCAYIGIPNAFTLRHKQFICIGG